MTTNIDLATITTEKYEFEQFYTAFPLTPEAKNNPLIAENPCTFEIEGASLKERIDNILTHWNSIENRTLFALEEDKSDLSQEDLAMPSAVITGLLIEDSPEDSDDERNDIWLTMDGQPTLLGNKAVVEVKIRVSADIKDEFEEEVFDIIHPGWRNMMDESY